MTAPSYCFRQPFDAFTTSKIALDATGLRPHLDAPVSDTRDADARTNSAEQECQPAAPRFLAHIRAMRRAKVHRFGFEVDHGHLPTRLPSISGLGVPTHQFIQSRYRQSASAGPDFENANPGLTTEPRSGDKVL